MLILILLFLCYSQCHFNTSHVNVNPSNILVKLFHNLISIHLMLMLIICAALSHTEGWHFNTSHVNVDLPIPANTSPPQLYFNSSHVNVNLVNCLNKTSCVMHFNTSHVNVNLPAVMLYLHLCQNFNTSHVNVNP